MTDLTDQHVTPRLRHVAIIMDGNNRWARERGLNGIAGHRAGVENVRQTLEACRHYGVETLTLFAFSSENWQRPQTEVRGLMSLFATYIRKELKELSASKVRLRVIGERSRFSERLRRRITKAEAQTAGGKMNLVLAVDYGGRWDITQAARKLADKVARGDMAVAEIDEHALERQLSLADLPPPDLCIRTAGEQRISNFMLWQLAYSEFYFADCYWPDFDRDEFTLAVEQYRRRDRRFGLNASQLSLPRQESA